MKFLRRDFLRIAVLVDLVEFLAGVVSYGDAPEETDQVLRAIRELA